MNGWSEKDKQGEFTFVGHQGRSVVDYLLLSTSLFDYVTDFQVSERTESDHMPITWSFANKIGHSCNTN